MKQSAIARVTTISCVALLALAAALVVRPTPSLFRFPLIEDGYYALTAARHLGTGGGLSVDGIHPTSGVQPLWVFLLAPFAWIAAGERTAFVRWALALHWILYAFTAGVIAVLAARAAHPLNVSPASAARLAAFLYLSSTTILELHFNGLETGLTLLLYAAVAFCVLDADWRRASTALAIGLACGLLVLARVDTVFFVALLVPVCVRRADAGGLGRWLRAAVIVPLVAAAVSAPWFIYNVAVFGRLMPSGGAAQLASDFSPGRGFVFGMHVIGKLVPLPFDYLLPFSHAHVAAIAIVAGLIAGAVWWRAARPSLSAIATDRSVRVAALFLVNAAIFSTWYGITSRAWWMYPRYAAPIVIVSVPALALVLLRAGQRRTRVVVLSLLIVGWVSVVAARYLPATAWIRTRTHHTQVELANRVVPANERIGATQTGTLGYFREGVVNLDGKVNEEALRRRSDLERYCHEEGIRWLVDGTPLLYQFVFRGTLPRGWSLVAVEYAPGCELCDFSAFRYSGPEAQLVHGSGVK
jgi:hypothetical protein